MKVLLFGATGMVGQGVLRECLLAPDVEQVTSIVRSPGGQVHDKLRELVHRDFTDFTAIEEDLRGCDACFFCLGVSSSGMGEAEYTHVTYDFTLAAARALAKVAPGAIFVYVSGAGTDSSERGRSMWARVKGRTENALLALPLRGAYMFRPGGIRPMHGEVSKTRVYRVAYAVMGPLLGLGQRVAPGMVTSTEAVGRAMLHVARHGADKHVLENRDINDLAAAAG